MYKLLAVITNKICHFPFKSIIISLPHSYFTVFTCFVKARAGAERQGISSL